ncbi:MAG: hypothetical protein KJ706_08190 [Candidatus Omnitrophica bacterium]|nr:hypothetical protein [Candidatus Omnitrophota bacterium]MBU4589942.1 hypothetical protein [Candidatus Omnitrophota bacterium]
MIKKTVFKNFAVIIIMLASFLFMHVEDSIAQSVSIKGIMKIHRMGGYAILINYETHDRWTDNIVFKVHCKFEDEEFTFMSSSMNNLERGWHKTQIAISDVIKKRYGSLRGYKVELYRNGILVATKNSY